jgi:hypothetical protein
VRYTLPGGAAWHQTDFAEARINDTSQFVDHYEEAVFAMLKKKQAGLPVSRECATPRPQIAVDLMDALRCSIVQEKAASGGKRQGEEVEVFEEDSVGKNQASSRISERHFPVGAQTLP